MNTISNRSLLIATALFYLASLIVLVYASLTSSTSRPSWGGYLDAGIAVLLVMASFTIFGMNKSKPNFEIGHRAALNIIPLILLGMWIFRNALDFNILLPGLAWRTFLFLHILPFGINLWNQASNRE